jgi:hypothetical protein
MPVRIPRKPFDNYKWRWAEVTPSEGLNNPLRFLGVLRAIRAHEGLPKSTLAIRGDLERVERDTNLLTGEDVHLARVGTRNLFRNSDRYWKALGVMDAESRMLQLTRFGRMVADGEITQNEFAITVIRTLTLPNRNIEPNYDEWVRAGFEIKPLRLILNILRALYARRGVEAAFLTPFELRKIIIPLAGESVPIAEHVEAIELFRLNRLNSDAFPDCAPGANDRRMVREFLLFLSYYGFCTLIAGETNEQDRFQASQTAIEEFGAITRLHEAQDFDEVVESVRIDPVITDAERKRILVEILARPQQARFRRRVLNRFDSTCILTGERSGIVLEACHVIPVRHNGTDTISNGLCLRADIHILFDSKHIRFHPDGHVQYSDLVADSASYGALPERIDFPNFLSQESIRWRYEYY